MKVFTIYSESHAKLFKKFKSHLGNWADLKARKAPQLCSGDYRSENSVYFYMLKCAYFMEICETEKEFLYLDCDVICTGDPTEDLNQRLGDNDLIIQRDKKLFGLFPMVCGGIFYVKVNDRTKEMFRWMLQNIEFYGDDQRVMNRYLLKRKIKWDFLPETYWSLNFDNGNKVWDGKRNLVIKNRPYKMFHLNWAIGENKFKLLGRVKPWVNFLQGKI